MKRIITLTTIVSISITIFCLIVFWPKIYPAYHLVRLDSYKKKTPNAERIYSYLNDVSNDSEWIIKGNWESLIDFNEKYLKFSIENIDFPLVSSKFVVSRWFHFSHFSYIFPSPSSWSPDGKTMILVQSAMKTCTDQNFAMFHLQNGIWNGPNYFINPSKEYGNCYGMVWSDDGAKLAVYSLPGGNIDKSLMNIKIFNTKAKLLREFNIHFIATENCFWNLYWEKSDFYITPVNHFNEKLTGKVYTFSINNPNEVKELLTLRTNYYVINKDPDSNKILLSKFGVRDNCEFIVFNIDKNTIEKRIDLDSTCGLVRKSTDNKTILFLVDEYKQSRIKIWDWKNLNLIDKDIAEGSLEWNENLKSFVMIKRDRNLNLYLSLFTP